MSFSVSDDLEMYPNHWVTLFHNAVEALKEIQKQQRNII
jgi:hypothetical protein